MVRYGRPPLHAATELVSHEAVATATSPTQTPLACQSSLGRAPLACRAASPPTATVQIADATAHSGAIGSALQPPLSALATYCTPVERPPTPSATGQPCKRRHHLWADLMRRTFAIDVLACDQCGGRLRLIATIESPTAIRAILEHLGLPSDPPALTPARAPPASHYDAAWN
ncbi:hypothetical protein JYT28_00480 [Desulfobulbus sp. AH-315-M07]|nr:hypothetical protein [Desulfobulbus sp. AH-315-M07]